MTAYGDWRNLPEERVVTVPAPPDRGARVDGMRLLAARDVPGAGAARTTARAAPAIPGAGQDLHEGDLLIHEDHGPGRFAGTDVVAGPEAIRLTSADGEAPPVPAAAAGWLWRHGHDEGDVPLDAPGGRAWIARRADLSRAVGRVAARRALRPREWPTPS